MDCTQIMRTTNDLIERIDEVFKRTNPAPIYETEQQMRDAISDNVRYFDADRKAEAAEILYAVLCRISDNILHQDLSSPFCNPQTPSADNVQRLPEMDMLMRCLMPLGWSLSAAWAAESLRNTIDPYLASYSESEAKLLNDIFVFLFETFPEYRATQQSVEFQDYWRRMAGERETLHAETDADKSELLTLLMKKRAEHAAKAN